jgi:hypothetical protein
MQRASFEATEDVSAEVENNHPNIAAQRTLQKLANNSLQVRHLTQLQDTANHGSQVQRLARTREMLNNSPRALAQRKRMDSSSGVDARTKENRTGLPDNLKSGIENLSGVSLDGVEAHFNSSKPAELKALAYTQGRNIYVGPGQERHLPHEAWHVVQQSRGRVTPTTQAAGVAVNDDKGLEQEADVMGAKGLQMTQANRAAFGAPAQRTSDGQSLERLPALQSQPAQRMTAEDLGFLFDRKFGLRHHGSLAGAQDARVAGTAGGDAVPLNPLGQTRDPFDPPGVSQMKMIGENALQLQTQSTANPVVQLMYKGARADIEQLLSEVRPDNDDQNEADAKLISKEAALDATTKEQVDKVFNAVSMENFQRDAGQTPSTTLQSSLLAALQNGSAAFATKLLALIVELSSAKTEETDNNTSIESPAFEPIASEAVATHLPEILGRINEAQSKGAISRKPLLVMVGEKHDDPYSKLIEAILVNKLKLQKLFIEATPEAVAEHIEPYRLTEPTAPETSDTGHRQRFYRYIYQQGATFEGVDVDKELVKKEVEQQLGPRPEAESERTEWKAKFMEQSVVRRNIMMSKTLTKSPLPGLLLVGATHLPGLAADVELANSYEVVTISIVLPQDVIERDMMAYGRQLETTKGLPGLSGLLLATNENMPGFQPANVPASDVYKLADSLVLEMNKK